MKNNVHPLHGLSNPIGIADIAGKYVEDLLDLRLGVIQPAPGIE
jgi:hypothetical protein